MAKDPSGSNAFSLDHSSDADRSHAKSGGGLPDLIRTSFWNDPGLLLRITFFAGIGTIVHGVFGFVAPAFFG